MTSLNHRNNQTAHAPITARRGDSQRDNIRVTGSVYVTATAVCQLPFNAATLSVDVYASTPTQRYFHTRTLTMHVHRETSNEPEMKK